MNPFYTKTVTVYNKYSDSNDVMGGEVWLPTGITNVRLQVTKGANVATSGLSDADSASLHIRKTNLVKPYLSPLEWQALENTEKPNYFTLTGGTDFFVEGDTSAVTITEDDFFSYMKAHYSNCYKITNVDEYDLIPHFECGGE